MARTPIPTIDDATEVTINTATSSPARAAVLGIAVTATGAVPRQVGMDRKALASLGFTGNIGQTFVVSKSSGPAIVAFGIGDSKKLGATGVRHAAAAFARASGTNTAIAISLAGLDSVSAAEAAQAIVEGALLARYRFRAYKSAPATPALKSLTLVAPANQSTAVRQGIARGRATAGAAKLARDLANSPHNLLSATTMANIAVRMGKAVGLKVETFDKPALIKLGCGGLLGVNAGSVEPPRMIKLTYTPKTTSGKKRLPSLALVGKGIMYDSGGLALKPGDEVHAAMKNDMSGAGAILAAMLALPELNCPVAVTGFLMCTDNIPSATAMALGDVITIRGGKTVEVINTDAEGRLVMADALVLATEESHDAIVNIATLTGACMRALGTQIAGVIGNNQDVVDQIRSAADATDEPVWQLPLEERYRKENASAIADLRNIGITPNGGALHAALFLSEFVGSVPWAHIDIAGTALSHADTSWYTPGCSGFGTRLLIDLALNFSSPQP